MDAIASQGLAIGFELGKLALVIVAVLSSQALREGRGLDLKFKIPSFSLDLRVPPDGFPENGAPPQGTGSADTSDDARGQEYWISQKTDLTTGSTVDSRES